MTTEVERLTPDDVGLRRIRCPYIGGPDAEGWKRCAWTTEWQEPPYAERYAAGTRYRTHYQEAHMPQPIIEVVAGGDAHVR